MALAAIHLTWVVVHRLFLFRVPISLLLFKGRQTMYVVELTYLKPLDAIDVHLEAHRKYLEANYAREIFLASGPKNPRNGGVILASGRIDRSELDAILEQDPFKQNGLASYHVIDFAPVKHHSALAGVL